MALGTLALVALGAAGLVLRARGRTPSAAPGPSVATRRALAVVGFRNVSGRPDAAWVSTALAEALSGGLASGGHVRVIPGTSVASAQADLDLGASADAAAAPAALARLSRRLGADLLVAGTVDVRRDGSVHLELRVSDASGRELATIAQDGTLPALVDLASHSEDALRRRLALGAPPAGASAARAALPGDPEAARLYAEGLGRLRVFDAATASQRFEAAAAIAPADPLVHLALAEALSMLGHDPRARSELRSAFEHAAALPLADRLRIEARHNEVIGEHRKAVELYRTLASFFPDSLEDGLHLAAAQLAAGRRPEALDTLDVLRRLPQPLAGDPRIDLEEARVANALGDYRRAQAAALRAVRKGEELEARSVVARARLLESYALRTLGEPQRAVAAAEDAGRLFAAAGDQHGAAGALNELANIQRYQGDLAAARHSAEQARSISRAIGNTANLARATNRIASVDMEQGRLLEARHGFEEAMALWREVGDASGELTALNNVGESLWKQGALGPARATLEQAVARFREAGSKRGLAFALFNLGFVLQDQGDLAGARRAHEESLALTRAIGEKSLAAVALAGLGASLAAQGDAAGARRALEESLALRRALDERGRVAETRLALAALDLDAGRPPAEAAAACRESAEQFARQQSPQSEAEARAQLVLALLAAGRLAEARAALATARGLVEHSQYRRVRWLVTLADARFRLEDARPAEAVRLLKDLLAQARQEGAAAIELECRLVLAEAEVRYGDRRRGLVALEELAGEAEARGAGGVARQARAQMEGAGGGSPAPGRLKGSSAPRSRPAP